MAKSDHDGITEQGKAARQRLEDAKVLLAGGRWRGAMYVSGYAVECILKVRLMRKFGSDHLQGLEEELERRRLLGSNRTVYTHQLLRLLQLTGAEQRMRRDAQVWGQFSIVNRWVPAWRYASIPTGEDEATLFLAAIERVLGWIENNA